MPPKKHIIIIGVLCVIALASGYWYGLPKEEGSGGGGGGNGRSKEPEFLKQGLVAYYPFNGNAKDESGNGHDGEVHGATLASDRLGNANSAYDFDGANDSIAIGRPTDGALDFSNADSFTLSAWIRATEQRYWQKVISLAHNCSLQHIKLDVNQGGGVRFGVRDSSGTKAYADSADGLYIFNNEWNHLVGVRDVSSGTVYLYFNGVYVDQIADLTSTGFINPAAANVIGKKHPCAASDFLKGGIDDVRIYNRALSGAEVKELYEFEKAP